MNGLTENGYEALGYCISDMESTGHKVFNDSVHGHITLHPLLIKVVDTPEFQRTRNLKQVGLAYYVFPGASHCRFEHSLGTCYLAGQFVEKLFSREYPQRSKENHKKLKLCVQMAALCHDLGHGPFSHTWEAVTNKWDEKSNWQHELSSIQMFDYLLEKNNLKEEFEKELLGEREIRLIKELIMGKPDGKESPTLLVEDYFLYEIVSNKKTGIDVDKWDYFLRDGLHLNLRITFDYMRLLEFCMVLPSYVKTDSNMSRIAFRDKEILTLYDMYRVRSLLHFTAYRHPVVLSIELMCCDAFEAAGNAGYRINESGAYLKEAHLRPESMADLTDHVFYDILYSQDDRLSEAKELLQRVLKRELYKYVGYINISEKKDLYKEGLKLKEKLEISFPEPNPLKFEVVEFNLYLDSNNDPIRNVSFYKKTKPGIVEKQDFKETESLLETFPFPLKKEGTGRLTVFCKTQNVNTFCLKKAQEIIKNFIN